MIANSDAVSGKLVVITGVARGLGRAMVEEFISAGQIVAGCSRNAAEMEALNRTYGNPHDFVSVDVTDAAAVDRWAANVTRDRGAPLFLINNAALINQNAALWEVDAEEFSRVIDVNIKGVQNVIRAFVPAMLEAREGVIVNFSSGWGRSTSPEVGPYCATKWAIEGLTQSLAQELPNGLAAIPLNPGVIDTEMLRSCFGSGAGAYPGPERWAQTAVPFILSLGPTDNGQSLSVPGA